MAQAVRKRARKEPEAEEAPGAVNKLTDAANQALETNSKEIAECLVKNMKKGHAASAKLLVELAAKKKRAKTKRKSAADELAAEETWQEAAEKN
jgi:hypothetical protein